MIKERIHLIDNMRGFCMMAILLNHTEIYYSGNNIIPYSMYTSNVLMAFFFQVICIQRIIIHFH